MSTNAARPLTYTTDVRSGYAPPRLTSSLVAPFATRLQPPRDVQWDVQRIRLGLAWVEDSIPTQPKYTIYSGLHGQATNVAQSGSFPTAGVWLNAIQRDREVLWVGCLPPGRSEYAPQFPVRITDQDTLICAVAEACDYPNYGPGTPSVFFSVRFAFDVLESVL